MAAGAGDFRFRPEARPGCGGGSCFRHEWCEGVPTFPATEFLKAEWRLALGILKPPAAET